MASDIKAYHPLQKSYEAVLRGEKTWDEYGRELWDTVKKNDENGQILGIVHVLSTIERKSPSARERSFWRVARTAVDILETDEISRELKKSIHAGAVEYGKTYREVLQHPEFWQTLLSTAVIEDMDPEELKRVEEGIRLAKHVQSVDAVQKHVLEYSRTVRDLAERMLRRKHLPKSRRGALASVSTIATIRAKTMERLMARRHK